MYASFSSALTTRKERSGESGSKPKWRKTTTRGEMVSHGERREYGRSRERGGGEGGSLQREGDVVSSRPVDEMATAHPSPTVRVFPRFGCRFFRRIFSLLFKERRFPNPPPARRRPLVPARSSRRQGLPRPRSTISETLPSVMVCVLPRGSVPRFPPAPAALPCCSAPRPSGLPALSLPFLLRSIIHRATEQLFTIQNPQSQISNNFLVFLAPSPGKEGGSA